MLGLVHGYNLSGTGSNLWTNAVARALCVRGETIHLLCQEGRPDRYNYVSEAWTYDADGTPERQFSRETGLPGRCVVHRPRLEVLPIFVPPPPGSTYLVQLTEMDEAALSDYLDRHERALRHMVEAHGVAALHVNHVVPMAHVVHRVASATGVPYAVMPHGSAIEYVVRKSERWRGLAEDALRDARRIFLLNNFEMRERVLATFPDVADAETKMTVVRAGVDTDQFAQIEPSACAEHVRTHFFGALREEERGRSPAHQQALREALRDDLTLEEARTLFEQSAGAYAPRRPDAGLETTLAQIDWAEEELIVFVGQFIGHKGVPSLVAALPEIVAERPRARLLLVGRGPLREVLEALVAALATGRRVLAEHLLRWGGALEGEAVLPFEAAWGYLEARRAEGTIDAYFETAERVLTPDRVLFTGYLTHDALRHLLPCCAAAVFPSRVAEGSPLVVPEAAASGVFPMGTNFAGMQACLDAFAERLPPDAVPLLRLRPDAKHTVADVIANVPRALALHTREDVRRALRTTAEDVFDWRRIAADVSRELRTFG